MYDDKKTKYIEFPYRYKSHSDGVLITTDHGGWAYLTRSEFEALKKKKLSSNEVARLEDLGIIMTENNQSQIESHYKGRFGYVDNGASLHIIITTLRCNHKCVYCHSAAKPSAESATNLKSEVAKKIIDFAFTSPSEHLTIEFQGGEPSMNFEAIKEIVTYAKAKNTTYGKTLSFPLISNLVSLSYEDIDWYIKNGVTVSSSLDGPKEVHDKNRIMEGGAGTYDDVTSKIEYIKEKYDKTVGVLMVTTKYSLPYYKEIVDEYVKWDQHELQLKILNKLGFAPQVWDKIGYTIDEFLDFYKKSLDYMIEVCKSGKQIRDRYTSLVITKLTQKRDPSYMDFKSPCGMIGGQIAYNYNGDIYSCDEGRAFDMFKIGNVFEDKNYSELINKKDSKALVNSSINDNYICNACVYKPFCGVCPVMNYAESGSIVNLADSYRCRIHMFVFDYVFDKLTDGTKEEKDIILSWGESN